MATRSPPPRQFADTGWSGPAPRPARKRPVKPVGPAIEPLRLEKRLTVAEAKKLAAADYDLCLFGLSELSADVATALAAHRHTLSLPGLVAVDADFAAPLVRHVGPVALPELGRLESTDLALTLLSPGGGGRSPLSVEEVTPEAARVIVNSELWDGDLPRLAVLTPEVATLISRSERWNGRLPRLAVLAPEVAANLAAAKKWDGQLPGVTAFTAPDSVAVAAALATRVGPLALPNLKKISPKTLGALFEKHDVEIPLIEILELVAEPDGSPTDDVVIP